MLKHHTPCQEMGADYFAKINSKAIERNAVKRLEQLGYRVTLVAA